ncbi:hypothetical protein PIB30_024385 [Stylosanthes scabra]|uniref:Uncharacterized protein n=1 Tax=Stylosanthes scabra TaxID=79078 RepID=A0ABU6S982_9FABA|nr:hypothetical protein [Stylosanthes scabra]
MHLRGKSSYHPGTIGYQLYENLSDAPLILRDGDKQPIQSTKVAMRMLNETPLHAIRYCLFAAQICSKIINLQSSSLFFAVNIDDWINVNLDQELGSNQSHRWIDTFMVTAWKIWNFRNEFIHANVDKPIHVQIDQIWRIVEEISAHRKIEVNMTHHLEVLVAWKAPS